MKVAIVYSFEAKKTSQVAKHIVEAWGKDITVLDADKISGKDLHDYDVLIIGAATWFDGELPGYWDEMVPELEQENFPGKKVAIYGLGNQKEYPENFCDAIGLMADLFSTLGSKVVGYTSTEGYNFEQSHGVVDGKFAGLALDIENQSSLTNERIKKWVAQVKKAV